MSFMKTLAKVAVGVMIAKGVGEIIVAVLAQVADLERQRINERTEAGRQAIRAGPETARRPSAIRA